MEGLVLADEVWDGDHHFAIYDADVDAIVNNLAAEVRKLYVEPDTLRATLEAAVVGLEDIVDVQDLQEVIGAVTQASIPEPGTQTARPWLDTARNEVAEVLACLVAEAIHNAPVLAPRVRNKEVSGQPSRGIDLLGFCSNPEHVLCGEVKASSSSSSPPSVVAASGDSIHNQLTAHLQDKQRMLRELGWVHKHAREEDRPMVGRCLIKCHKGILSVTAFPFLLRPATAATLSDFQPIRDRTTDYGKSVVKFCVVRVPCTIEELAERVYRKAREDL